jgi:archaellum component FlaC
MLDDLKAFFGDSINKSAEDTKLTVEELSKNIDAQITELAEKHDSLSKAVQDIKSAIDTIEKRVDMVESETAVKKSGDLDRSKEETTIRKGIWSGTFLNVRDL